MVPTVRVERTSIALQATAITVLAKLACILSIFLAGKAGVEPAHSVINSDVPYRLGYFPIQTLFGAAGWFDPPSDILKTFT